MNYLLSLLLSALLGFLIINLFCLKKPIDLTFKIILSIAIGLGLSGEIVFYSLLINGSYSRDLIWGMYAGLLMTLGLWNLWHIRRNPKILQLLKYWQPTSIVGLGILSLLLIPLWREAHFFPFGGWDAWACWNLKARFIFLGGEHWTNMFDPLLWRSNNQYPFLLPLINVWGWGFYNDANVVVPMFNTILFSFLTAALLYLSLHKLTQSRWAFIPSLALFSIPFVVTLSISQYSDIVVAFFLLAAFASMAQAKIEDHLGWAVVGGCSLGLLSFSKTEGMIASVIVMALALPFLVNAQNKKSKLFIYFIGAALITALPTIIFKLCLSPANTAFINGLTSVTSPSNLFRLQATFMFLAVELISAKWNGLWILLLGGLLLSGMKSLQQGRWIIPAFLVIYLGVAFGYYYLNTYFEITWWLKVSLNRILYTILPTVVWWTFYSLWSRAKK